jgi:hypothetical protein
VTNFDQDGLTDVYEGTRIVLDGVGKCEWEYSRLLWRRLADVVAVKISCMKGKVCGACHTITTTMRDARMETFSVSGRCPEQEGALEDARSPARYKDWPC